MTVIEMARELGKKIQQEESYILLNTAQQAVEEDEELQEKIAEFNMKRYELTQEITKADRDDKKIEELDKVVRELYDVATNHEKMVAYNNAQDEFNEMFEYVLHIIQMSATGDDPDTIERPEQGGCSGDCSSCGGCG
ncbi:MAG: YlbF family regulator [Oscillospiraceae bacterium]|nr:YlbF family regulator [Oscillospiraceae bacterium]